MRGIKFMMHFVLRAGQENAFRISPGHLKDLCWNFVSFGVITLHPSMEAAPQACLATPDPRGLHSSQFLQVLLSPQWACRARAIALHRESPEALNAWLWLHMPPPPVFIWQWHHHPLRTLTYQLFFLHLLTPIDHHKVQSFILPQPLFALFLAPLSYPPLMTTLWTLTPPSPLGFHHLSLECLMQTLNTVPPSPPTTLHLILPECFPQKTSVIVQRASI